MGFARWIRKATDTLIIFDTYCSSTATLTMQTCLNVMCFIYIACLVLYAEAISDVLVQSAAAIFWMIVRWKAEVEQWD